ncbi:MAG: DUF3108 domain-containing protein [Bacteroidales bacterium]
MIKQKIFLLSIPLIFYFLPIFSQNGSHMAFEDGEIVEYKAYYNWNFVWLYAGDVTFTVDETTYEGLPVYHLEAQGNTIKSYEWLYKVDDYFQSYVDKNNFQPVYYERNTNEGKYSVHNRYEFNHNENYIFSRTENSKKPYEEDLISYSQPLFDVLSAIYYSRNIPYDTLNKDEKIPLPMIVDNELYDLYLRYRGKEKIDVRDIGEFNCIKFTAKLVEGTIFKGGEHLTVWVTDDKNRIPVIVEAKILVGSVKAIFRSADNLKYPSPLSSY